MLDISFLIKLVLLDFPHVCKETRRAERTWLSLTCEMVTVPFVTSQRPDYQAFIF